MPAHEAREPRACGVSATARTLRRASAPRPGRAILTTLALAAAGATIGSVLASQGAMLRDPTRPPPEWGPQPAPARPAADAFRPGHLVVIDGQRYVMWRGRRFGVGESIGGARIERIDEAEVWLRTAEGMRRMPLYAGVEKRAPATAASPEARKGEQQ